ncbi:Flp pilus assembly protein CpaB [Vibrio splendidus]|uniref:Flp pilus assembly protein CpaB n=2 Tax=Vibrio lentus TaxID=136468 RepID=A0A855IT72_9VIBR|nr:Flp pilus assembly protein CpaB [Vibrio lentus]PHN83513.1 Flp pilus assembly protein CpaB [Vibrio splendidus]MCB5362006.1 Flp pilus assembly protein CpaB [Vibrio lentus]MCB5452341.1 Flp pilus assembly protein CpaB [Vibrio lentus]MCB5464374.1 Flp pilus assembly protein CpaB [Vibrio lentus]MCB5464510.1 Flp pilus assembly protein CpaB [Vibrio lentus]
MKNTIIVTLAVLAIIVGVYGLSGVMAQKTVVQKELIPRVYVKLWELREDVETKSPLSRELISVRSVEESEAHQLGFAGDVQLPFKPGTLFRRSIEKGALITPVDLISPDQEGYVDFIITKNRVPYPVMVPNTSIVGGVIKSGDLVDVLAFTGGSSRLNREVAFASTQVKQAISVTPIFSGIKVLQVQETQSTDEQPNVTLVLELDRPQAVTMTLAKRISELEIHKSLGKYDMSDLHADAGDILPGFESVVEHRAGKTTIN